MLTSLINGYDKYPSYQMLRTYNNLNSIHLYNPDYICDDKIKNTEALKKVRAKISLDNNAKNPLVEDVNFSRKKDDDSYIKLAQNILGNDRVSLSESTPAAGSGLQSHIPGVKPPSGYGSSTHGHRKSKRGRSSIYDYLL